MKPYYDEDGITIYHGDCQEILPSVEADLVLTDPPYVGLDGGFMFNLSGIGARTRDTASVGDPWDANLNWMPLALKAARKGLMSFCSYHFVSELGMCVDPSDRLALLTWYRRNSPPRGKNVPRHTAEFIWVFRTGGGLKWDGLGSTVLDIPKLATGALRSPERLIGLDNLAAHPTQKPLQLIQALLAVEPASVLDPFMGTGTTLRAAKDRGIPAIGIEIEERYCEIAVQRLAQGVLEFL